MTGSRTATGASTCSPSRTRRNWRPGRGGSKGHRDAARWRAGGRGRGPAL